jgi:hypothetical protein
MNLPYINKVAPIHEKNSCSDADPCNARYAADDFGGCYRCTLLEAARPAPSERQPAPKKMEIRREGNRFWHINCTSTRMGGIMKESAREPDASVMECLRCGQKGRYPVGSAGSVFADFA